MQQGTDKLPICDKCRNMGPRGTIFKLHICDYCRRAYELGIKHQKDKEAQYLEQAFERKDEGAYTE